MTTRKPKATATPKRVGRHRKRTLQKTVYLDTNPVREVLQMAANQIISQELSNQVAQQVDMGMNTIHLAYDGIELPNLSLDLPAPVVVNTMRDGKEQPTRIVFRWRMPS